MITFYQIKYPSSNQWPVVELKTLNLNNFRHTYPFWTIFGQDERSRRALTKYEQKSKKIVGLLGSLHVL